MIKTNKKVTTGIALALMAGILPSAVFASPATTTDNTDTAAVEQAAKAFADLPEDHWAFDAVQQLADDCVVIGYEDTLFKGDRHATRYEMAMVTARAMAVMNKANEADRALIHKLAIEFANELDGLGIRVTSLEQKVANSLDNVKWNGEIRYNGNKRDVTNQRDSALELRLEPTAKVNDNFKVVGRLSASIDEDNSKADVSVDRVYAEADYQKLPLNVKLGQVGFSDDSDLLFDADYDSYRGGVVKFGNELQVQAGIGRWEGRNVLGGQYDEGTAKDVVSQKLEKDADYQFIGAQYDNGKVFGGAAYHHLKSESLINNDLAYNRANSDGEAGIWTLNAGYRFDGDVALKASYAKNDKATIGNTSKAVQLAYKGANADVKNSWGLYAAYKDLGANTTFSPSGIGVEKLAGEGVKGYQLGVSYAPWQNVVVTGSYFKGKNVKADQQEEDANSFEGRVSFFF